MKDYFVANFESGFVLMVILIIILINYYFPLKLAFLDFYYIPVLLAAIYLGTRKTLYGAILCVFFVVLLPSYLHHEGSYNNSPQASREPV